MGNETAWASFDKALRGEHVPIGDRSDYNDQTVIRPGGGRSQNIGCIHAVNDLYWAYHHDQPHMHQVFGSWLGYAGLGLFMTTETWTQHIYQRWIIGNIERVVGLAMKVGREDVAQALLPHLRTFRALAALSSGWRRHTSGPLWMQGYPVMMCGSRSFASGRGADGKKRDSQGRPNPPWPWMCGGGSLANHALMMHLHYQQEEPLDRELRRFLGVDRFGLSDRERKALRRICRNNARERHYLRAVDLINAGPEFAIPGQIIRTDQGVAFVAEKSIAPGSTSFCYGKIWHEQESPNRYWRDHYWPMGNKVDLVTCDPSMRTQGKSGRARVARDGEGWVVGCQRRNGQWFDTRTETWKQGWFEQRLEGRTVLRLRLNKRSAVRAEILELNP